MDEIIKLTQNLVRIPSTTGKEGDVAEFIARYFTNEDIPFQLNQVEGNRHNVIAQLENNGNEAILFNGHMDTVPVGDIDKWHEDPYSGVLKEGRIFGRGSSDMKGGLASALVAMKLLKKMDLNVNVVFSAVVGEEDGGIGIKHLLKSKFHADMAVVCEPTDLDIVRSHKGVAFLKINVGGKDPISRASNIVKSIESMEFNAQDDLLGKPSATVGTIKGKSNLGCDVTVDRRILPDESLEDILEDMKVATNCNVDVISSRPPMVTHPSEKIAKCLKKAVYNVCGVVDVVGSPGGTDASYLSRAGIPSVVFGPGSDPHVSNESVEVEQLHLATRVYVELVKLVNKN